MGIESVQLAWCQPKDGKGPRVLELWANGRRVCGIADCDDNATLEQIVQMANDYEDVNDLREQVESLGKENQALEDRIEELEEDGE